MNDQASSVYSRQDYERRYRAEHQEKIRANKAAYRQRQREKKKRLATDSVKISLADHSSVK